MTPALAEEVTRSTGERFEQLSIDVFVPSTTNPRTHFDPAYIADLARSIVEKGLIQPIVVRPLEALRAIIAAPEKAARTRSLFEIVAGECRYRASKQAGLSSIPAIIREYSDEQVLEVQLIENIHRTDLTPLEQARGYRRLIDTNPTKHSAETIAARVGMSPAWVWDRLKLNDLTPEAKQLLETERMSIGHAILIARLKPEQQERVIAWDGDRADGGSGLWVQEGARLDYEEDDEREPGAYEGLKPRSVRELEHWIADHIRFDVTHAAQAAPLQFEAVAERVDQALVKPGRGKKVIAITFESYVPPAARSEGERIYGPKSWKRADGTEKTTTTHDKAYRRRLVDSPRCEFSVLGVVAAGDNYGQAFDVCIARDKCQVHWGQEMKAREKTAKPKDPEARAKAEEKERREREKREAQQRQEEAERNTWLALQPKALKAFADHVKDVKVSAVVVRAAADSYKLQRVEALTGKLTDANIGQVLTVLSISSWSRADFLESVKPFKFNLSTVEKAAAPPKASAEKKAAKAKPAGKKR